MQKIKATVLEVLYGVIPISVIITLLQFTPVRIPWELYIDFLFGTLLLIVGLTIFLIGVEIGFIPIGETMGSSLVATGNMRLIVLCAFLIGFAVTIPEPDVQVLVTQVAEASGGISKFILLLVIATGVGLATGLALYRIFKGIQVKYILTVGYVIAFILLMFAPPDLARVAFDSGGVTTGSLTVPFIMSLGVGVASVTAKKGSSSDTFGILAIASLGPVLTILIMGVLSR